VSRRPILVHRQVERDAPMNPVEEIKYQHGDDKRYLKCCLEKPVSPVKIEPDIVESSHIDNKSQKRTRDASPGAFSNTLKDTLGESMLTPITISNTEEVPRSRPPTCKSDKGKTLKKSKSALAKGIHP